MIRSPQARMVIYFGCILGPMLAFVLQDMQVGGVVPSGTHGGVEAFCP
jgi:hypothetical protein